MGLREFHQALQGIGSNCQGATLTHNELVALFVDLGFFSALGYGAIRADIRIEERVRRGRVDVVLRAFTGRPVCLIEFKPPGTHPHTALRQLDEYVRELLPRWAVITTGLDFWLFGRGDVGVTLPAFLQAYLPTISLARAKQIYERLRKQEVDLTRLREVRAALEACRGEPTQVTGPDELGGGRNSSCDLPSRKRRPSDGWCPPFMRPCQL